MRDQFSFQGLLLNFEMMGERKFVSWQQIWENISNG